MKNHTKLTRKQLRQEKRKEKKLKRNEYYINRGKPGQSVESDINKEKISNKSDISKKKINNVQEHNRIEANRKKTNNELTQLNQKMKQQRTKQLLKANADEDRTINRLTKLLKLNKHKKKSIPKSFGSDGLDYLLEVCDPSTVGNAAAAEEQFHTTNDDFQEDFELMTGTRKEDNKLTKSLNENENSDIECEEEFFGELSESDDESEGNSIFDCKENMKRTASSDNKQKKKVKFSSNIDDFNEDFCSDDNSEIFEEDEEQKQEDIKDHGNDEGVESRNKNGNWEDIYGRLRSKDGDVIEANNTKYIPPAMRTQIEQIENKENFEKLNRLKKLIKGLLNRLAESNMHNISSQIENLYMNNSRNDMNSTLTNLVLEAIVSYVLTPERLLIEHVMLVTILHTNVGTEVGAHFLQMVIKKFDELFKTNDDNVENKSLVNIIIIISQLYNFKLVDSKLIFEISEILSSNFKEKQIECIIHILKNVGFTLRKDNPLGLKTFILKLQTQANKEKEENKDNARAKYLLDILLAIKNNNVSKIPNYDTSYSEHLKKIMKGFIRKGNYTTQLNVSLEDLLKVDERGRWWIVGSAWSGNAPKNDSEKSEQKSDTFSEKLLELAKRQRMNTDTRRTIFCIIMSSEDYMDAFEKLLRLGLKNQQEREIINIILHCCLQEKYYNPYYSVLAEKFCESDRKYQIILKYSVWDKLKTLNEHSGCQISNLAKLLSHLFLEKGLSISILKIVQFSELDKVNLRFMRQILIGILLHEDLEMCQGVFEKLAHSEKLKMFRDSLRLFIHHFVLRNLQSGEIPVEQKTILETRAKIVEKMLIKGHKTMY